jgi:indole-3-glycerol phosphate synthase
VPTYLDRIVAAHRAAAARDDRPVAELVDAAAALAPVRGFARALGRPDGIAVIAEIKRRSPSRGALAPGLDPAEVARAYADGGASCLSVLTDAEFFGGSPGDLVAARAACELPVLRKDFTVDERDVADARLMGADAVLLIVAALSDDELRRFAALASELGLDALVEIHDRPELERALEAGATVVGVNQRDLTTFEIDRELAVRLAPEFPADVVTVAESGVRGADDTAALAAAGYDAVLVGESLVTDADHASAVAGLVAAGART